MDGPQLKTISLHGRDVSCAVQGGGSVLLLIHGMGGSYQNWQAVIEPLARHHTVVAPDLPGHGASAPGAGDYSLGALAASLRDLLVALGHERATLVGHSLGGGVAMQIAYQFPELTERLVLVSSGGLGPEVSLILSGGCARLRTGRRRHRVGREAGGRPAGAGIGHGWAAGDRGRGRGCPRVRVARRSGSPRRVPGHAPIRYRRTRAAGRRRLEIFENVGHLPQLEAPARFVAVLERFLDDTEPAHFDRGSWRARLQSPANDAQTAHTAKREVRRAQL
jgi:pimeloyl-ACP methyl ester carboxylesterase